MKIIFQKIMSMRMVAFAVVVVISMVGVQHLLGAVFLDASVKVWPTGMKYNDAKPDWAESSPVNWPDVMNVIIDDEGVQGYDSSGQVYSASLGLTKGETTFEKQSMVESASNLSSLPKRQQGILSKNLPLPVYKCQGKDFYVWWMQPRKGTGNYLTFFPVNGKVSDGSSIGEIWNVLSRATLLQYKQQGAARAFGSGSSTGASNASASTDATSGGTSAGTSTSGESSGEISDEDFNSLFEQDLIE